MKVIRKLNGKPAGSNLNVTLQYNVADIKAALLCVNKNRPDCSIGITMDNLVNMLYKIATDEHMPDEPRLYIAEWMVRRAVKEGFVFKANDYLGEVSTATEIYLIDVASISEKMRGRPRKRINQTS